MCALQPLFDLRPRLLVHLFVGHPLPRQVLPVLLETDAASLDVVLSAVHVVLDLVLDDERRYRDGRLFGHLGQRLILVLHVRHALLALQQTLPDLLAQRLQRLIVVADALGKLVVQFGKTLALDGVNRRLEVRRLAGDLGVRRVLRSLDVERPLLSDR